MKKHSRFLYQPVLPLGENRQLVTGCSEHRAAARQAAAEGTVLLKNDGLLPFEKGAKICLFGRGAGEFLFGGGGSGRVYTDRKLSLGDALSEADRKGEIKLFTPLADFYTEYIENENRLHADQRGLDFQGWEKDYKRVLPQVPEDLYRRAVDFGGTAVFILTRYSSEESDRTADDFYLSAAESEFLRRLCRDFSAVAVILNVCGTVSCAEFKLNPKIKALLLPMYGGSEGGEALCDILLGRVCPSGHLQDSIAVSLEDYPSTASMLDTGEYVRYTEDIFTGYRYFETFCPEKVVYPFGYGLSYTKFSFAGVSGSFEDLRCEVKLTVRNTGAFCGKEVPQLYLTAPQGRLGKAARVLCAFGKTRELKPGESQALSLSFDLRDFASFDDIGRIRKGAFILEKGSYTVSLGTDVREAEPCLSFELPEDVICSCCRPYLAPSHLPERLCADGSMETLPAADVTAPEPVERDIPEPEAPCTMSLADAEENGKIDDFIAGLSDEDLTDLLYGHPQSSVSDTHGIGLLPKCRFTVQELPLVPTADGPSGLRTIKDCGVYTTFFPCPGTVAQTWNLELAEKIAGAGAREVKENNIGIWLTPALNIHRSPLCGRNFEYYSEDPLCSGLFAAASVKGIQKEHIAATIKHFCCNNKENGRKYSESCVSERALREIYLRGFEICIKKADPWAVMTSYNCVNGHHCSSSAEAINGILRSEWGYQGVVMTDWWTNSRIEDELYAGSDVKMPEKLTPDPDNSGADISLPELIREGRLSRGICRQAAYRILTLMSKLD